MDRHMTAHEHISALIDGELASDDAELALATLGSADGHAAWLAYHLIGDALRESAVPPLGDGFGARLAARLQLQMEPDRRADAQEGVLIRHDTVASPL